MLRLVDSGVPGLDAILGGGLYAPSVVLLHGSPGTGKTLLMLQILFFGARSGERVLYVNPVYEPMEITLDHISRLGFYQSDLLESGRFTVMDLSEMVGDHSVDLLGVITDAVSAGPFTRIGMDHLELFRGGFKEDTFEVFVIRLVRALKSMDCVIFLTTDQNSGIFHKVSDFILQLRSDEDGKRISVEKARGSPHTGRWRSMEITERGVIIWPE